MSGGSQLDAYNLALAYLGTSKRIQSITEQTPEAGYCNTFWDRARKIVLEQCYWTFATRAVALAPLLDQLLISDPSQLMYPGWRFVYQRPVDCLKAQAVTTLYGLRAQPNFSYWWQAPGTQPMLNPYRPPWTEALDYVNKNSPAQQVDILTDQESAWLVYTTDISPTVMSETLLDCVAWQLAVRIAGPVSGNAAITKLAIQEAPLALSRALAQNLNEQQPDAYPRARSLQARV